MLCLRRKERMKKRKKTSEAADNQNNVFDFFLFSTLFSFMDRYSLYVYHIMEI